jgi:pimeloyl-ACP methyl ester carboxylesterase
MVHGLWMTGVELRLLGARLAAGGFTVHYFRYRSRRGLTAAAQELRRLVQLCDAARVHLVGHSLGGIVISRALQGEALEAVGRIALLGSPLNGSALAAALSSWRVGRAILGLAAREGILADRPAAPPASRLLIVAGTVPVGFAALLQLPFPNDGTVFLEETRVPCAEFFAARTTHMGMLFSRQVADRILLWFRGGE